MSEHLTEAEQKLDSAFQAIFQIATGALALSITFRGEIAPEGAKAKWILSLAWILLALVPISYVFLRLMEASNAVFWNNRHRELNEKIKKVKPVEPMAGIPPELQRSLKSAELCWRVMLGSFVFGIVALLVFGIINN
ncbi:hypothetical protein OPIT5_29895 [Opitutaceae bacterium TAV5]|nr:hypothetical protein OPIT5_29895 [Opitutaceae bacterium TAV5]